jgi:signal transduction histidine kinase/CheY-like chemotaxis protein
LASFFRSRRRPPAAAADPAALVRERHAARLFADGVRALYRYEISAAVGHVLTVGLVGWFLRDRVSTAVLATLVVAVWICALLRLALRARFYRLRRQPDELDLKLHSLAIMGSAAAWSIGMLTMLPALGAEHRSFMMMVLAGLTAGSLVTLATRLGSFARFSCTLVLPSVIALLADNGPMDGEIAALALLFLAFCMSGARKTARSFEDGQLKRYQNQEMLNDLAGAKHELEIAWSKSEAANQAKQRFLANVSHEVRTPLNGILGITDLLLDGELKDEQRNLAEIVKRCGSNLLLLINDLLDLSKIEAGKMKVERIAVELEPLLRDVEAIHALNAASRGVTVRLILDPGLPARITGDPTRLRQVLNNLVGNAVKFTDAGEVRIRAGLGVSGGTARLTIEVSDDGVGIPADRLDAIFESFVQADDSTTRKHGGTGLGLAITRHLIELMGGSIHVESTPQVGSTFRLQIPVSLEDLRAPAEAPTPRSERTPAEATPGAGRRVLLAEDGEVNAMVLKKILQRLGFEVQRVHDGQEAVDAFPTARADLVVLDLQMPLDGVAAAHAIRALPGGAEVPLLALSAHCDAEERTRCRAAGMDEALPKPCSEARLREVVAVLLPVCRPAALTPS